MDDKLRYFPATLKLNPETMSLNDKGSPVNAILVLFTNINVIIAMPDK
ncbi:Uncharacterised protein [Escherichia coli]|jgi:hypothetical protein|uniref:Uncharacterized protein n=1 Tax=Escherichia coli TaxID=562 RepID=A0A376L5Q9_ECOLX|nr:hypothetical protein OIPH1902010_18530 [Escherichia coli]GDF36938.1 hypothetical protein HmCmsJML270_01613 [Escherichia coli]STF39317.1 Uncharacterised protein [Escherichia coli]